MTTATTSAAPIFISAAATSATTLIARPCFIHAQRPSLDLLSIELAYRVLCIAFGRHGHKSESPGLPREFILHQQHFSHSTSLRKHVLQLELRRRERQVAYVQSISHNGFILLLFLLQKTARLPRETCR